jgi:hypothetical protein
MEPPKRKHQISDGSVAIIHPKETVAVPIVQAITKCSLFQKDRQFVRHKTGIFTSLGYSLSLHKFHEFVNFLPHVSLIPVKSVVFNATITASLAATINNLSENI